MKLKSFTFDDFCVHLNQNENQATTINVKSVIFNKSNIRLDQLSYPAAANRSCKVRCETSSQRSAHSADREVELHHLPWQPLEGLVRCSSNYVPLSPISFLERAAKVYRTQTSVVYGSIKYTWEETHLRCIKLASALHHLGVSRGDVVATLAPNVPAMLELHFAIPMAGATICPLNTSLDPDMLSILLKHAEAKILFVDYQLLQIAMDAIGLLKNTLSYRSPLLVIISEPNFRSPWKLTCKYDYESLLNSGFAEFSTLWPNVNECDPIILNYTFGTTSEPKVIAYSHRVAYLNSLASIFMHDMQEMSTYLWTCPMFHCTGSCFAWGMAIIGGTNICLRYLDPEVVFDNIVIHKVTHLWGAPIVMNMIVNSLDFNMKNLHTVKILTSGAPPPPKLISKIKELGFHVSHIYGLTETYGTGTWSLLNCQSDLEPLEESVMEFKTRQGVKHSGMKDVDVKDPITMESLKCDGESIGEVMFRGNTITDAYLNNSRNTEEEAFSGGNKDIVISGGKNICTIEIEDVIYSHPAVLEVAVVAMPDDYRGETPCAFVKLKDGVYVDSQEVIQHCRGRLPKYMVPWTVIFQDLPKNETGKVQKCVLREKAKWLGSCVQKYLG